MERGAPAKAEDVALAIGADVPTFGEFRRHDRHVLARRAVRHRLGAMTHEAVISIPVDETAVVVRIGARDARAGLGDLDFCAMIDIDRQPTG